MKSKFFIIFFLCVSLVSFSQEEKGNRISLITSGGVNIHAYTKNYFGWYIKLGAEYRIWSRLFGGIRLWHSNDDSFPSKFKSVPFSADDETRFINQFIGIPEKDWLPPKYKGFYNIHQGDIISFSLGYEFKIKKKFFVTPKYSFSLMRSRYVDVGLFEATFSNGFLTNGRVRYDIRIGNLTAGSVALDIGYKINENWKLFLEVEDIRDINGTGAIYYEAKTLGIGAKYALK